MYAASSTGDRWDPTEPIATRPLAIRKDGTWYCYGWDLPKNVCEVFGQHGYIRTAYTYTPYGAATADGDVTQPLQWSSEYADEELGLTYYNYRHYNPLAGRWISRDIKPTVSDYLYIGNKCIAHFDVLGMAIDTLFDVVMIGWDIIDIAHGYITGDDDKVTNGWIDLGADVVSAVVPFVPAGVTRGARAAEKAAQEAAEKAAKEAAEKAARKTAQKKADDALEEAEKASGKKRNRQPQKGCKPCNPPVGTLAYEKASLRTRGRHSRECGNHVKLWILNQSPYPACKCFWNFYLNLDNVTEAPSGSISINNKPQGGPPSTSEAAGGGPIK